MITGAELAKTACWDNGRPRLAPDPSPWFNGEAVRTDEARPGSWPGCRCDGRSWNWRGRGGGGASRPVEGSNWPPSAIPWRCLQRPFDRHSNTAEGISFRLMRSASTSSASCICSNLLGPSRSAIYSSADRASYPTVVSSRRPLAVSRTMRARPSVGSCWRVMYPCCSRWRSRSLTDCLVIWSWSASKVPVIIRPPGNATLVS